MKILVIGGLGLVGSSVASEFKKNGDEVIILDKKKHEGENYICLNCRDINASNSLLLRDIDACVNASGTALKQHAKDSPCENFNLNVSNVDIICNWCWLNNIGLTHISTYLTEDKYESHYAMNKYLAEKVCENYYLNFELNVKVVRLGNIYGKGSKNNILNIWIGKTKSSENLIINGSGDGVVSFVHVDEIGKAVREISYNPRDCFYYNLSSSILSINELFEVFRKHSGCQKTKKQQFNKIEFDLKTHYGEIDNNKIEEYLIKELKNAQG